MTAKRLVYLGTPEIAVPPLRALHAAGHDIALVVTNPDRRRGRGSATAPSPVKQAAIELDIPVTHTVDDVIDVDAELGVVVAFGRLIRPHVLAAVPMVNLHFSLLPRWRGAAPVERALLAGDDETGVAVMAVDETLDTGVIYAEARVPIGIETTADDLRSTLTEVGSEMLVEALSGDALPPGRPQVGEPIYAAKIAPEEWQLDWSRPAVELHRWIRCGHAWTTFRGKRLGVVSATIVDAGTDAAPGTYVDPSAGIVGTGAGALQLTAVKPEGRAAMTWQQFANGARPHPGEQLGPLTADVDTTVA